MANQQLSTNTFGVAKWIVSATASDGTHTTIAAALTSASSGDTIFIRPGTYTENLTLKAGVNLTAFTCDAVTPNVIIVGKCTFTATGSVTISGVQLQTNSDFCLVVSGSSASAVSLYNCGINALNNTAISFTSSNASAAIGLFFCVANLGTTGVGLFTQTSPGSFGIFASTVGNTGGSTTTSTSSSGPIIVQQTTISIPFATTSTGSFSAYNSTCNSGLQNFTFLTTAGTGVSGFVNCDISTGTASAISVGSGTTLDFWVNVVTSTNTNAITGAGTISYGGITFSNSSTINTSTQNPIAFSVPQGGTGNTTNTAYAVLCGGTTTTAHLQSIASVGTSGQVLTSNGAGALPTFQTISATGAFDNVTVQVFTGSGTYTPTSGMKYCTIECIGAGGAGGSTASAAASTYAGGGGGGGGGYSRKTSTSATVGSSQTVTIGAAGAAAATGNHAGGNGGDTSVGTICIGKGGTGGSGGSGSGNNSGGAGGVAGTGDFTFPGQSGQGFSAGAQAVLQGFGGNSYFGYGGITVSTSTPATGIAGSNYGAGGSGGTSFGGNGAAAGGAGTAGLVVITEFVSV